MRSPRPPARGADRGPSSEREEARGPRFTSRGTGTRPRLPDGADSRPQPVAERARGLSPAPPDGRQPGPAPEPFELAPPGPEAHPWAGDFERTFDFQPPQPDSEARAPAQAAPFELQSPAPEDPATPFEFLPPEPGGERGTEEPQRPPSGEPEPAGSGAGAEAEAFRPAVEPAERAEPRTPEEPAETFALPAPVPVEHAPASAEAIPSLSPSPETPSEAFAPLESARGEGSPADLEAILPEPNSSEEDPPAADAFPPLASEARTWSVEGAGGAREGSSEAEAPVVSFAGFGETDAHASLEAAAAATAAALAGAGELAQRSEPSGFVPSSEPRASDAVFEAIHRDARLPESCERPGAAAPATVAPGALEPAEACAPKAFPAATVPAASEPFGLAPSSEPCGLVSAVQDVACAAGETLSTEATPPESDSLEEALAAFSAEAAASAEFPPPLPLDAVRALSKAPPPRLYRLREVAAVLGAFAACALLLDSEGLLTWARRMDVGPVQSGWLAVLAPVHRGLERAHLTAPRKLLVSGAERMAQLLGTGEDPLFAEAWRAGLADGAAVSEEEANPTPGTPAASVEDEPLPDPAPAPAGEAKGGESEEPAAPVSGQTTVLLVGDSMMGGNLAASISRAVERKGSVRVVRAVQIGTGLTRPDLFDWLHVITPLVEREKPAFVVCSLGANDAQHIRQGERVLSFGEPAWNAAYRRRVSAMMRAMAGTGAHVLWLGLPPMRERRFSDRVGRLNRLFAQAARRVPRVEYLELEMLVSGRDGEYASYSGDRSGRLARLRMEDGVHYAPAGAKAIAHWVVDWMRERKRRNPAAAGGR